MFDFLIFLPNKDKTSVKFKLSKENNFLERYEKVFLSSKDCFGISYVVQDVKENFQR